MSRYLIIMALAAFVLPRAVAFGDGPATASSGKEEAARSLEKFDSVQNKRSYALESRMIYDLARLPTLAIVDPRNNEWVVARIAPDLRAMFIQDPEMQINEDGIEITPPGVDRRIGTSYIICGGAVEIHKALGKTASVVRFAEILPGLSMEPPREHSGSACRLYDVFEPPGAVVVCIVNDIFPGRSRYAPALAIPPKWEALLQEAARIIPPDADALRFEEGPGREQSRARLIVMAKSSNPFVSAAAFRVLSNADALGPESHACEMVLAVPDSLQQGALALLFLRRRPLATEDVDWRHWDDNFVRREQRVGALATAVAKAKDFHGIRGIALAAFVRLVTPPAYDTTWAAGRPLLIALRDKAAQSTSLSPEDADLIKAIEDRIPPLPDQK